MNERILVPLDGSTLAERALPHAIALAKSTGRALTLLRVVPLPSPYIQMSWAVPVADNVWSLWEEEPKIASEYLARIAEQVRQLGIDANTVVAHDDPAGTIVRYAEQDPNVSTIAMSTHGRSGLGRWIFGSVAEKVLQGSPVPLLLVRAAEETEGREFQADAAIPIYKTILVPLDSSPLAENALEQAVPLAKSVGARVVLVSSVPDDPVLTDVVAPNYPQSLWDGEFSWRANYLEKMKQRLTTQAVNAETHLSILPPAEAILQTAGKEEADLIVMSTHGRGGLKRLWLGSVANIVVRHAEQPVLLVRAKIRVEEEEAAPMGTLEKMAVGTAG